MLPRSVVYDYIIQQCTGNVNCLLSNRVWRLSYPALKAQPEPLDLLPQLFTNGVKGLEGVLTRGGG